MNPIKITIETDEDIIERLKVTDKIISSYFCSITFCKDCPFYASDGCFAMSIMYILGSIKRGKRWKKQCKD